MVLDEKIMEFDQLLSKNAFGFLATVSRDGSPHVTPLWIKYDKEERKFIVNIEEDSSKDHNIRREPKVCLNIVDPDNPYHYLFVKGRVIERKIDDGSLVSYFYSKYSNGLHRKPWFDYPNTLLKITIEPVSISGWKKESADMFKETLQNS